MKSKDNFIFENKSFRIINTLRIYYLILFIISYVVTETGRFIYRPYVYNNHIDDFGIADSIGNFGGILTQIFFGLLIINPPKRKGIRLIAFFSGGYIVYEILQLFLPRGVFDLNDIYGTLLGGILGFLIYITLHWSVNDKVLKNFN